MSLSLKDEPSDSLLSDCIRFAEKWAGAPTVGALVDEINRLRADLAAALAERAEGARLTAAAQALVDYEQTGGPEYREWDQHYAALKAALKGEL